MNYPLIDHKKWKMMLCNHRLLRAKDVRAHYHSRLLLEIISQVMGSVADIISAVKDYACAYSERAREKRGN